jgi:hypothetical protein
LEKLVGGIDELLLVDEVIGGEVEFVILIFLWFEEIKY